MKKYMLFAGIAMIGLLASCSNDDEILEQSAKKVPMTLTASIAGADDATRATISDDGTTGLKIGWSENDKVSVMGLDDNDNVVSNDVFSATNASGATAANFSGELTTEGVSKYVVYYPALTKGDGSESNAWATASGNIYAVVKNKRYLNYIFTNLFNPKQNDPTTLDNAIVLTGSATVEGSKLNVTMNHRLAALKVTADFSEATDALPFYHVTITPANHESAFMSYADWDNVYNISGFFTMPSQAKSQLKINNEAVTNSNAPDGKVTLYYPVNFNKGGTIVAGTTWTFAFGNKYKAVKTFTTEKTLVPGKCYTINFTKDQIVAQ